MKESEDVQDVQIVHALPGRIRLKLDRLRKDPPYADEIHRELSKVSGIRRLEANPLTATLLIEYDPGVLNLLVLHPSLSTSLGLSSPFSFRNSEKELTKANGRIKALESEKKELRIALEKNTREIAHLKVSHSGVQPKRKPTGKGKSKTPLKETLKNSSKNKTKKTTRKTSRRS